MQIIPENLQKLIDKLERLPGLGPKSAARIAMYLLKSPKEYNKVLGDLVKNLQDEMLYCKRCFHISSSEICDICNDETRDSSVICVVEDPLDVLAFERGAEYKGLYHVLGGVISPVNGIGPEDLTINELIKRFRKEDIDELVIATNPNIEGEATAMYIKNEVEKEFNKVKITRLARGLPTGADLEYADKTTLSKSFEGRTSF